MINYYEEFNLDSSKSVSEIKNELTKQEDVWRKRELISPEKARKKLTMIAEARDVFSSEAAKIKYDRDLENSKRKPVSADEQRENSLQRWVEQARTHYREKEYDLAKVSIEKAFNYISGENEDTEIFSLSAEIYLECNEYDTAINNINKAIVLDPGDAYLYLVKANIYLIKGYNYFDGKTGINREKSSEEGKKLLNTALSKAESANDNDTKATILGVMAFYRYFHWNTPDDKEKAAELAFEAQSVGTDIWGSSQRVLDDVEAKRKAAEEAEKAKRKAAEEAERAKRKAEEEKAEEIRREKYNNAVSLTNSRSIFDLGKAVSEFKSLGDYKDAVKLMEQTNNKIETIKEETRQAEIAESIRAAKRKKGVFGGVFPLMIIIIVGLIIGSIRAAYIEHHKCGDNLTWDFDNKTGVLTITGEGDMFYYSYTSRNTPWKRHTMDIKQVIIENGCSRIGGNAFCGLGITEISIPDSVTHIGDSAFSGCKNLENVQFSSSLKSIDQLAFDGCTNLKDVQFPPVLNSIGGGAFRGTALESLNLPTFLKEFKPSGMPENLKEINVSEKNVYFTSVDGVLFNKDMTVLVSYPCGNSEKQYTIPDGVIEIGDYAFSDADNLKSVVVPDSVTKVGMSSFAYCDELSEMNFSNNLTYIGYRAFSNNSFSNYSENLTIQYEGTEEKWSALTKDAEFNGKVICQGISKRKSSATETENNNTPDKANLIEFDSEITGSLSASFNTEKDWYKFTVPNGKNAKVELETALQNDNSTYWDFYVYSSKSIDYLNSPAGLAQQGVDGVMGVDSLTRVTPLFHKFVNGNETFASSDILSVGTYYIRLESSDHHSKDSYTVIINDVT